MLTAFKVLTSISEHSGPDVIDIPLIINHIEIGALCLLKNKKSSISAMTDYQLEAFNFEKVEVEYAIYDTNVSHDAVWING